MGLSHMLGHIAKSPFVPTMRNFELPCWVIWAKCCWKPQKTTPNSLGLIQTRGVILFQFLFKLVQKLFHDQVVLETWGMVLPEQLELCDCWSVGFCRWNGGHLVSPKVLVHLTSWVWKGLNHHWWQKSCLKSLACVAEAVAAQFPPPKEKAIFSGLFFGSSPAIFPEKNCSLISRTSLNFTSIAKSPSPIFGNSTSTSPWDKSTMMSWMNQLISHHFCNCFKAHGHGHRAIVNRISSILKNSLISTFELCLKLFNDHWANNTAFGIFHEKHFFDKQQLCCWSSDHWRFFWCWWWHWCDHLFTQHKSFGNWKCNIGFLVLTFPSACLASFLVPPSCNNALLEKGLNHTFYDYGFLILNYARRLRFLVPSSHNNALSEKGLNHTFYDYDGIA